MTPRRISSAVLATALAVLSGLVFLQDTRPAAAAGSAVTVAGAGDYADLKVTVAQTTNLINQVVNVTWTGGKPTADSAVHTDYLQIMQCWGDAATGPAREQCQFGTLYTDARGGSWTGSRQVTYAPYCSPEAEKAKTCPAGLRDPLETITMPDTGNPQYVPFTAFDGTTIEGKPGNEYFDATTTNEIPYGRTGGDGAGEEFFEVQTLAEAPGLGCGALLTDGTGRPCWLVVVPRGATEVDGSTGDAKPHRWLDSSPLSATNWAHRIVVPLKFQPIGRACPLGSAERRTVGAEAISEAILRWQPALCAGSGSTRVFGFSQTTDELARDRLAATDPGLVFVNRPATPDPARPEVYAPVAVSGLTIAMNIDWQSGLGASAEQQLKEGKRLPDLKLTPRLVAKLLTQTYPAGADAKHTPVAENPFGLSYDEEFRELNPDWIPDDKDNAASGNQLPLSFGDALVGVGQTDMATQLWEWILTDAEAKAFLTGTPDKWGTKVNPVYSALKWPQTTFPKSDLYCTKLASDAGQLLDWCTLDMHPYANNMHDAARSASRGDTLVRNATARDNVGAVIGWKKGAPQSPGKRSVLAVTDVATAERYGLPMVKLRNAAGEFVAPTTAGLLAGVSAMTESATVEGVLAPNPAATDAAAYPLTSVLYAGTVPSAITEAAGKDYADLLRYAAGNGQTPGVEPGTLPFGYAPLPDSLRAKTREVAATLDRTAGVPLPSASPTPSRTTATTPRPATTTTTSAGIVSTTSPATVTSPAPTTAAATTPAAGSRPVAAVPTPKPAGHGSAVPVAETRITPASPLGNLRYGLVAAIVVGAVAALAGPILLRISRSRSARTGR
ncbi:hypothetical protein FB565_000786 [Actinoplanes lutulentus]|uniref:PBP domain-containing protein n=1 Tax=Actinoplanes lutulentus TaxID=1287878 RepID=A0A327ZLX6_9ACTN|nr:hypothetical protein [Actinoplanes lutulentus]MBB2941082.1 hypothetical protein [Actinoplanes lutulentus]RAK43391.1 hypothetical protein B0I29_101521 [Actinoplanes lutulentus]